VKARLGLGPQPRLHPANERLRRPGGGAQPAQQIQKGPVALIGRPTAIAGKQVLSDGPGLFRTKLPIQIFPEPG
jgi:hypothetical protein